MHNKLLLWVLKIADILHYQSISDYFTGLLLEPFQDEIHNFVGIHFIAIEQVNML